MTLWTAAGWAGLVLLISLYFAFAYTPFVSLLKRFRKARRFNALLMAALLLVPILLAALPMAAEKPIDFVLALVRMAIYLLVPTVLLVMRPARNPPLDVFDILAILAVWFPVEFDWLPEVSLPVAGVNIPVPMLTAICLGLLLFLVVRPLDRIGYSYHLTPADTGIALLALFVYAVVGLPLGIALGFIRPGFAPFEPVPWLVRLLAIYFLTAIPEELLFRGAIQNLIQQRFGQTWAALAIAAVIFGLSHLNNTTAHNVPPNWPYVIMATLAGLAYGWTWRRRSKITASAVTHTLVNFIWGVVFRS